ncbi:MAG: hypothetical protein IJO40_03550 [Thermoguttaceae bacterium]|nr:hypothetical protein [Thermoguttaceae bacterium]
MKKIVFFTAVFVASVCVGCGGSGGGSRAELVPAAGVVTLNGEPVADATLEFRSATDVPNSLAAGRTDADGKFTLTTDRPNDGALPGSYKVVVKKEVQTIDGLTLEEWQKEQGYDGVGDPPEYDKDALVIEQLLPVQYSNAETTPLTLEVPAKGNKKIAVELTD